MCGALARTVHVTHMSTQETAIVVGDRFEHPYELDPSYAPTEGEAGTGPRGRVCQVVEVQGARVLFRHVVDGSLWGYGTAPTVDVENATRLPRG